jgi:hypothetical protein
VIVDRVDVGGWIPMRWPWSDPGALELLAGTPVSCLVVPWADGSPGDGTHQRSLAALVAAARGRGLAVVGWVSGTADLRRAAGAARASDLAALATESTEPVEGMDVLRFRKRGFGGLARSGFLGDADALWPGMRPLKLASDVDAVSGATSRPWIDSNAWYVRLARTVLGPEALWLAFDPPDTGQPVTADAYLQAIADSEIGGARWMVSLDPSLRAGLAEGRPQARETWTRIARSLALFKTHEAWTGLEPVGQIGVLSDYAGENEFLSFEVLNLLARRSGLYRVLPMDRAEAAPLDGLDSVLCVDPKPPAPALVKKLHAFAENGGTLVTPPGWEARGVPDESVPIPRFRLYRCGRGRLAVAREDFADPDLVAEDAQLLTSHRHDRVRVFNLGVGHVHYATSADGRTGLLHALAFPTPYPRGPVAAWFRKPWARGRVLSVDSEAAAKRVTAGGGVEFHLPPVPAYAALEVSA